MDSFNSIEDGKWWHVKIDMDTEVKDEFSPGVFTVDSPLHYLFVMEVFHPILMTYSKDLYLWRFHRQFCSFDEGQRLIARAAPIHQFKFKFYCTEETARRVIDMANSGLKKLKKEEKKIFNWFEAEPSMDSSPVVGSDRDQSWPHRIKLVWPYFIHGVSMAWYKLVINEIEDTVVKTFVDPKWLDLRLYTRLPIYSATALSVRTLWVRESANPFFHHMNGVFGYQKVWLGVQP